MAAQKPAQVGHTESCPDWEHKNPPRMGAQRPAQNERSYLGLPGVGAPRLAQNGRTEACPEQALVGLPRMGAQKLVQDGREQTN